MQILDNLFGPAVNNFGKAMSRATLRESLLTNNLANVNTPGYKRRDVGFGITLEDEQNKLKHNPLRQNDGVTTDESSIRVDGSSVDMETEVMGLAQTELRYDTLTQMTSNYFSDLKSVIKGGS